MGTHGGRSKIKEEKEERLKNHIDSIEKLRLCEQNNVTTKCGHFEAKIPLSTQVLSSSA